MPATSPHTPGVVLRGFVCATLILFGLPVTRPASSSAADIGVEVSVHASRATVRARSAVFGADTVDQSSAGIDRERVYVASLGTGLVVLAVDGRVILLDRGMPSPDADAETIRNLIPTSLHLDPGRTTLPPLFTRVLTRATISTTGSARLCSHVRSLRRDDAGAAGPCIELPAADHRAGAKTHLLDAGSVRVSAVALGPVQCSSAHRAPKHVDSLALYQFDLRHFSLAADTTTGCDQPTTAGRHALDPADALIAALRPPHIPKRPLHLTAALRPATLVATHRDSRADRDALHGLGADLAEAGISTLLRALGPSHRDGRRSVVALKP